MFNVIYQIIIHPLTQFLEFFYQFMYEVTDSKGIAVIGLSFIVTLCTLPLYMVAESWQEKERLIQSKMKNQIDRIKRAFKGDEQYMILSTYYKQNNYKPIMALRSSFGLLIQIPFFIAAYHFLSELGSLKGYSFLFIKDFGAPDNLFTIGNFPINVLPIAMTLINLTSGILYSKGHDIKEKIQIFVFAFVFLILLYNSPAGLVVYWTMNNILSLVKNIFYKINNPKKCLYIISWIFAFICLISPFTILSDIKAIYKLAMFTIGIITPFFPLLIRYFNLFIDKLFPFENENKVFRTIFILSSITLAVLTGLVIPSILIESEPNNYCYVDSYKSPFVFLKVPFYHALGLFVFWPTCFYFLFSNKVKKVFSVLFSIFTFTAIINCFAFSGEYGPIEPHLIFMEPRSYFPPLKEAFINFIVLFAVVVLLVLLLKGSDKNKKIVQSFTIIILLTLGVISTKNIIYISKEYKHMNPPNIPTSIEEPIYSLSKKEKNVIIIMQDRCFSPYVPYVFDEHKHLKDKFDGFTYYPNTISFGRLTMLGTPGLFGGYDYTPYEINKRTNETLQKKHNEALLTLPVLFTENGYTATVCNLPYENYLEQPLTKMYEKYPQIKRYETLGRYTNIWYKSHGMEKEPFISHNIKRNFIWFSIFKIVPPVFRQIVYHRKYWQAYDPFDDSARFVDNYSLLDYLPELTEFDSEKGALIVIDNEATHEPVLLQAPDYRPAKPVTNHGPSPLAMDTEYSTMCGVFLRYAEFFDYLKENGVYDNTRIIIVSDHGMLSSKVKHMQGNDEFPFKKWNVTATLIVKDFNEHGVLKENNTFMTNADTPYLATKELITNAKNPFTKNPLEVENKEDYIKIAICPAESTRIRNKTQFTITDKQWYTVKNNIFDEKNWNQYIPNGDN